jgi:Tfp pilus assembly protein PilV
MRRTRCHRRRQGSRARRGFTIIEVLVAAVMLLAGLVGLAAASAAALRALADARFEELAAVTAGRRMELLRATPCAARTGGEHASTAMLERWTVAPYADAAASLVIVTVAPPARPAARRRYETVASC